MERTDYAPNPIEALSTDQQKQFVKTFGRVNELFRPDFHRHYDLESFSPDDKSARITRGTHDTIDLLRIGNTVARRDIHRKPNGDLAEIYVTYLTNRLRTTFSANSLNTQLALDLDYKSLEPIVQPREDLFPVFDDNVEKADLYHTSSISLNAEAPSAIRGVSSVDLVYANYLAGRALSIWAKNATPGEVSAAYDEDKMRRRTTGQKWGTDPIFPTAFISSPQEDRYEIQIYDDKDLLQGSRLSSIERRVIERQDNDEMTVESDSSDYSIKLGTQDRVISFTIPRFDIDKGLPIMLGANWQQLRDQFPVSIRSFPSINRNIPIT